MANLKNRVAGAWRGFDLSGIRMPHFERRARRAPRPHTPQPKKTANAHSNLRTLGLGLITGAADDDPSAIGTYASAGATFGPSILWTAPALFPMMVVVVYLSAKLGQVTGQGLAGVLKRAFPRWVLVVVTVGILAGNIIEAGADLGGIAAAAKLLVPISEPMMVVLAAFGVLAFQFFGSYTLLRDMFRWLALALLAYVGAALLAHPGMVAVFKGTVLPAIHFNREFLGLLVAVIGTSLSPYLYVWQASQEVEEDISMGRRRLADRKGTTAAQLKHTAWDVVWGMFFSNIVMYFIILCTGATLFRAGQHSIGTAAQAAAALQPLAGSAAGVLFAAGVIGVGFLAVPVMTGGAAYVVCDTLGWKHSLTVKPSEAKGFYGAIALFTLIATGINFFGINPMHALVGAGIVQGFLAPALMVMIMLMTSRKALMGEWVNTGWTNVWGWLTTAATGVAAVALIVSWVR